LGKAKTIVTQHDIDHPNALYYDELINTLEYFNDLLFVVAKRE
jgi:hypothetical protein